MSTLGQNSLPSFLAPLTVETQCSNIVSLLGRFQSLDLGRLATLCALLRLPKMPELRNRLIRPPKLHVGRSKGNAKERWRLPHFEPAGPEVDIFSIPYADAHREAARQKRLTIHQNRDGIESRTSSGPHKSRKVVQSQGRDKVLNSVLPARPDSGHAKELEKKRGRHAKIVEEWGELAKEERLFKKLRKRKVTQEQFDNYFLGDDER
jgi:ATP-dependent RNA helicase DDX55/SPB4